MNQQELLADFLAAYGRMPNEEDEELEEHRQRLMEAAFAEEHGRAPSAQELLEMEIAHWLPSRSDTAAPVMSPLEDELIADLMGRGMTEADARAFIARI